MININSTNIPQIITNEKNETITDHNDTSSNELQSSSASIPIILNQTTDQIELTTIMILLN